ncbi:MAG: hypothetical protein WBA13_13520 [Microcoleaceae cyanobacterium]
MELPKDEGILRYRLAQLQNKLGENEAALLSAQQSLERFKLLPEGYNGKRQGKQLALETIGVTSSKIGSQALALDTLNEALTLAKTINYPAGIASRLNTIGNVFWNL